MDYETILLLFDRDHPCWDEETLVLIGEDCRGLKKLEDLGFLEADNGIYSLTEKGRQAFKKLCIEQFIDEEPATSPKSFQEKRQSLWRTRLQVLLDNSFTSRWGLKEFYPGKALKYVPPLRESQIFELKDNHIDWTYLCHESVVKIKEHFNLTGLKAREATPPGIEEIKAWMEENEISRESFVVDLFFLSRYDFAYYMQFPKHPNDILGLVNADRFFFFRASPPFEDHIKDYIETIGKVHLFLMNQRHICLPGYYDLDLADQDSLSWVIWVTETEEEALRLADCVKPFGQSLIEPARPMDIWIISAEKLKEIREKQETLFDLFSLIAHPVARTI